MSGRRTSCCPARATVRRVALATSAARGDAGEEEEEEEGADDDYAEDDPARPAVPGTVGVAAAISYVVAAEECC